MLITNRYYIHRSCFNDLIICRNSTENVNKQIIEYNYLHFSDSYYKLEFTAEYSCYPDFLFFTTLTHAYNTETVLKRI